MNEILRFDVEAVDRVTGWRSVLIADRPLLYLSVHPQTMTAAGERPALLHRFLADLGYVGTLVDGDGTDSEHWLYQHPDGVLP